MNISDMKFGNIDARQEILARDVSKRKMFLSSFFAPLSFQIDELLNGEKFIIVGPKGSGKTAYLRYLNHKLQENPNSRSSFVVFRDDITSQDREKLVALAGFRIYDSTSGEESPEISDCLSAWQIFIHREIATLLKKSGDICGLTPDVLSYIKLLESFFSNFKTSGFKNLLKKITKGKIKIGALGQGLEAEVDFIDSHGNIHISEFARYCNSIVKDLHFNSEARNPRINIFFDEINISFVSGVEFRRDAVLIRDLVSACGIMNTMFSEAQVPIFLYSAIRSEVVESVESSVRELHKWVDDKGVYLNWMLPGIDYPDQPFFELLRRRIQANILELETKSTKNTTLNEFFEDKINGRPFTNFLLFETWARPRDLVRMLTLAAPFVGRGKKFDSDSFFKSKTEYSRGCWEEKRDELNSKYSQSEIQSLQRILSNFQTSFTLPQLETRIIYCSKNDNRSKQFVDGRNIDVLLEDMFKVGILGNLIKTAKGRNFPAFLYTGYNNFSSEKTMCVHRSLWRHLQLEASSGGIAEEFHKNKRRTR